MITFGKFPLVKEMMKSNLRSKCKYKIFFIIEEAKEAILDFSQRTLKVL